VSTSQSTPPWLVSAFYPDLKWAAKRCEDPLEPELEIIDSHHHLYDRAGHRYLLPELLADIARGHNGYRCADLTVRPSCASSVRLSSRTASPP
jgi:L-fuconolactonase